MRVEFTGDELKVMQDALDKWGVEGQVGQTVEECAELIVALQKYINREPSPGAIDDIVDEIADVEMMLAQMRLVLDIGDTELRKRIEYKFAKLCEYMSQGDHN